MDATADAILMWLTFGGIVAMIAAYALERWAIELISIASLVFWLIVFWLVPKLFGIETPLSTTEVLAGFSNDALVTVLAMLIVGAGLFQTDALERPAAVLARLGGRRPMGAVVVDRRIHDAFMTGPEHVVEFFHGYTYSGHPLAAAAALAALDVYRDEALFARARALAPLFEEALHALRGTRHVIDIRNLGLMGAVELEPRAGEPTLRAMEVFRRCFQAGVLVRTAGDTIALTPPLVVSESEIARIADTLREALAATA